MKPILPKSSVMGGSLPQIHSILASPGATIIFAPPMAPTFPVGTQGAPQPTSIILPTPTQGVPQPTPLIFPLKNKKVTTSANLHSRFPPLLAPKNVMLKPESENQTLPTKSAKGKKLHLKKSHVKDGKLQQKAQQARSFSVHVKKSAFLEHPVKSILPKFPLGDSQTLLFVPAPLPIQNPSVVSPLTVSSKTAVLNQGGISIFQEGQKGSGKVVRLSLSQRYAPPGGHNPHVKNCCSKSFPVTDDVQIPLIHPKRIMGKSKHKNVIAKENNKKLPHPGLRQKSEASCAIKVTSEAKSGSLGPPKNRLKKNENKISTLFPENVFKNFHTEFEVERIQGTKNKLCDKSKAEPNKKISILTPQDQTSVPSKHMSQHVALQFSPEQGVPHHPPPPYPQHSTRKETDISSCNTELPIGQEVEETVKEIQCLKTVSQKLVQISKKGCERRCRRQLSFVECPTSISVGITSSENNVTNTSCSSNYANELQISVPSLSSPLIRSATSSVHHSHPEYNSSTLMVSKLEETQKNSHSHLVIVTSSGSSPISPTYSTSSSMAKNASTVLKSLSNSKDPPLYVAPPALPAMNSPTLEESIFSPTSSIKSQSYSSSVYSPVPSGRPLAGASSNRLSNSSSSSTDFMHSPLSVCQSQFSSSYSPVLTNGHTTPAESSVLTPPLLDTSLITSSSHSSYQMSNSHQPKSTHYTVSTETPLFTQSSQSTSSCQPPQPTPRISPSYSTFYNRSQPAQCDQSPLSLLHTHASCPSSYIHSSQLDSYSYSHQPSSYAQSPQPTTYIKSPQPTSYTQSPQPTSYTQSPQPSSYTQSPQPTSYTQSPQPTTYTQSPQPTLYTQSPQPSSYAQSHQLTSYTQTSPQLTTYTLSTQQPPTYTQSSQRTCYTQSPQPTSYTYTHHPASHIQSPQPAVFAQSRHPDSYIHSEHRSSYSQSSQPREFTVETQQCANDNDPDSPQALSFSSSHVSPYCQSPQPGSYSQPPHTTLVPANASPTNSVFKTISRSPHLPQYSDPCISPSSSHYFPSPVNISYNNVYGSQQTFDTNNSQYYVTNKGVPLLSSSYSTGEVNCSSLSRERLSPPSYEAHLQNTASYITSGSHPSNSHYNMSVVHQQTVPENYSLSCHSTRVEQEVSTPTSDLKKSVRSPPAYPSSPVLLPPPRYTSNLQVTTVSHHSNHVVVSDINKGSYVYSTEESLHSFFPNTPPLPPPSAAPPPVETRTDLPFLNSQDYGANQSHSISHNSATALFSSGIYLPFQDAQHNCDDIKEFQGSHNITCKSTDQESLCKHYDQEADVIVSDWRGSTRGVGIPCSESLKVHSIIERAEGVWFIPHQEQNRVYMKRKELAKDFLNHPDVHLSRDMMLKEKFWIEEDEPIAFNVTDGTNSKRKQIKDMLCQVCGKMLKGRSSLKSHLNSHHKIQPHACHYCSKTFTNRSVLVVHLRIHTGEKPYICNICDTSFRTQSGLTRHKSLHTNVRPYECSMCSKTFKTKLVLQQHLKLHLTGLFTCSDCGKTFERHKSLAVHKASHHHKSKKFPCPHCHKGYQFRSLLNHHMQVHSNICKHVCSVCNKPFVWRSGLAAHMKTHSVSRPKCDICGMRFASEKRLDTHYRRHSNPQPHRCEVCGQSFSHAYRLASHSLIHEKPKEYACPECGVVLISARKLRKHLLSHRKEEPRICRLSGTIEILKSTT